MEMKDVVRIYNGFYLYYEEIGRNTLNGTEYISSLNGQNHIAEMAAISLVQVMEAMYGNN